MCESVAARLYPETQAQACATSAIEQRLKACSRCHQRRNLPVGGTCVQLKLLAAGQFAIACRHGTQEKCRHSTTLKRVLSYTQSSMRVQRTTFLALDQEAQWSPHEASHVRSTGPWHGMPWHAAVCDLWCKHALPDTGQAPACARALGMCQDGNNSIDMHTATFCTRIYANAWQFSCGRGCMLQAAHPALGTSQRASNGLFQGCLHT